ncbi:hypothetical protein ABZT06_42480 [Streptomyces sp. NPDC005483]|uniref:hypothetical protein n=1 Tax=Streptomyces sp. NPDC005483 TaxID=3154882 RepID=UPI0033A3C10F
MSRPGNGAGVTQTCYPVQEDAAALAAAEGWTHAEEIRFAERVVQALEETYAQALSPEARARPARSAAGTPPPAALAAHEGRTSSPSRGDVEELGHVDLGELLTAATGHPAAGTSPARTAAAVVRQRAAGRPLPEKIHLTLDAVELNDAAIHTLAGWASNTVRESLHLGDAPAMGAAADPGGAERRASALLGRLESVLLDVSPSAHGDVQSFVDEVTAEVESVRSALAPGSDAVPPPTVYAVTSLSEAEHLLHDLAPLLGVSLRAELYLAEGERRVRWADPDGRVHAFEPPAGETADVHRLSVSEAREAGLLPRAAHGLLHGSLFSERELAEIYRTSWTAERTFAEALELAAAARREWLSGLDPRLPDLMRRLVTEADAQRTPAPAASPARPGGDGVRTVVRAMADVLQDQRSAPAGRPAPEAGRPVSAPAPAVPIENVLEHTVFAPNEAGDLVALGLDPRPLADAALRQAAVTVADSVVLEAATGGSEPLGDEAPGLLLVFSARSTTATDVDFGGITVESVARALALAEPNPLSGRTPDRVLVLMAPGTEALAARLAVQTGRPVAASRFGGVLDPERRTLSEAPAPDPLRQATGFRLYTGDDPQGIPVTTRSRPAPGTQAAASATGAGPRDGARADPVPPHPPAHAAPEPAPAPADDIDRIDPVVLAAGVPRGVLPYISQVIRQLRALAVERGVTVEESVWTGLPSHLLSNYRFLVPDPADAETGAGAAPGWRTGLPVILSPGVEALVTLLPTDPVVVSGPGRSVVANDSGGPWTTVQETAETPLDVTHPAPAEPGTGAVSTGPAPLVAPRPETDHFYSNQLVRGSFLTGAHVQTRSGALGATRGALGLSMGVIPVPGLAWLGAVRLGIKLSGKANASTRSTSRVLDAEGGHVEVAGSESPYVAADARWFVKLRTDRLRPWTDIEATELTTTGDEFLLLYLPAYYLGQPGPAVTARGEEVNSEGLPEAYTAPWLTNLPVLEDQILRALDAELRAAGNDPAKKLDWLHGQVLDGVSRLAENLDRAVNHRLGFRFDLHDGAGVVASVELRSTRRTPGQLVGATTDKAHIENVRTAIDGGSGNHSLNQGSGLTLSASADTTAAFGQAGLTAGVSVASGSTSSHNTGRIGLWVLVPRYIGYTSAYDLVFEHRARVTVRGRPARSTEPVSNRVLLRTLEPEAFKYGFPVERAALKAQPEPDPGSASSLEDPVTPGTPSAESSAPDPDTVPYSPDALRRTGRREGDAEHRPLPPYVQDGRGIGMGIAKVGQETVESLEDWLTRELRAKGFLPDTPTAPLTGANWRTQRATREGLMANQTLYEKMLSGRALDSFYDQIHQTGLSFELKVRRGALGVSLSVDTATVTITATKSPGQRPQYLGSTDTQAAVNLAMGMGNAEHGTSAYRKFSLSLFLKWGYEFFKSGGHGFEIFRQLGASQALSYTHNRPELLEYSGILHQYTLFSDYTVTVDYGRSGVTGGRRHPSLSYTLPAQPAQVSLLPLGDTSDPGRTSDLPVPASVLKHAAVYYVDASGLPDLTQPVLNPLAGPGTTADPVVRSFTATNNIRAFAKEIIRDAADGQDETFALTPDPSAPQGIGHRVAPAMSEYTTDQPFDPGFWRDAKAAVNITGSMRKAKFAQATDHPFVLGRILLTLSQINDSDTSARGIRHNQFDIGLGGPAGTGQPAGTVQGGLNTGRTYQWNDTRGNGRTAGKEYIQLDFNRAYLFETEVDYVVSTRLEKDGKFVALHHDEATGTVRDKKFSFVLSEPMALDEYGRGHLPVSDRQMLDVMRRWNDGEVALRGDTVAGVLTRWMTETTEEALRTLQEPDGAAEPPAVVDRRELARTLARLHRNGALVIRDSTVRDAFEQTLRRELPDAEETVLPYGTDPYAELTLPEYLTRADAGGRTLGHSGVHDLVHQGGRTTYDIVREQVERVAPGLLTAEPALWVGDGERIGRLQGGVNALQALLGEGRDLTLFDDLLSPNGMTLYLTNPVGWLLGDVVTIQLSAELTSPPRIRDFQPGTGLENYGHGYVQTSAGRSTATAQSGTARFGYGETHGSDQVRAGVGEGRHTGSTRAQTATTEQTVYDWNGHYLVRVNEVFKISVRRVDMAGRPITAALTGWYRALDAHRSRGSSVAVPGVLDIQVPRGLGEFQPVAGPALPLDPRPLPPLPGDSYVTGTMLDDALPAARALLARMFGSRADGARTRTALTIDQLFTRTSMTNHIRRAVSGGSDLLTPRLHVPGRESEQAELSLRGRLLDVHVLGSVQGTGTGRYSKHQSGTSANVGHDAHRPTLGNDPSGSAGAVDEERRLTPGADSEFSRTTAAAAAEVGTANFRREDHVKQQGPTQLVRVRGIFSLTARRFDRGVFLPDLNRGTYVSGAFAGDVYIEMPENEIPAWLETVRSARYENSKAYAWRGLKHAPEYDLSHLLVQAARTEGASAARAHQLVARSISRTSGRPLTHAVLRLDLAKLDKHRVIEHYRWAVRTLSAEVKRARERGPYPEPSLLIQYRDHLSAHPDQVDPPGTADPDRTIRRITEQVNRERARMGNGGQAPPPALPAAAGIYALDHTHLIRGIAVELRAHLRVVLTGRNTVLTRWVEPGGRVHAFRPDGPGGGEPAGVTADQARDAGLLPDGLHAAVRAVGLDDVELRDLYRTSRDTLGDFAVAVGQEVRTRRERLDRLDGRLWDLLLKAAERVSASDTLAGGGGGVPDGAAREALALLRDMARQAATGQAARQTDDVQRVLSLMGDAAPAGDRAPVIAEPEPGSRSGPRPVASVINAAVGSLFVGWKPAWKRSPTTPGALNDDTPTIETTPPQSAATLQVPVPAPLTDEPDTTADDVPTAADLQWERHLEADAQGHAAPRPEKQRADFPASRSVAWKQYLSAYRTHQDLVRRHEAGPVTEQAASRLMVVRRDLEQTRQALVAWGHADPGALMAAYKAIHEPGRRTPQSTPSRASTPHPSVRSGTHSAPAPPIDVPVFYNHLDASGMSVRRDTLGQSLLGTPPGSTKWKNLRDALVSLPSPPENGTGRAGTVPARHGPRSFLDEPRSAASGGRPEETSGPRSGTVSRPPTPPVTRAAPATAPRAIRRDQPWRPLTGETLPTTVVRHRETFDLARLAGLDEEELTVAEVTRNGGDAERDGLFDAAGARVTAHIREHFETLAPFRTLTNSEVFLTAPDRNSMAWSVLAQDVANRLDHRVRIELVRQSSGPSVSEGFIMDICPQT